MSPEIDESKLRGDKLESKIGKEEPKEIKKEVKGEKSEGWFDAETEAKILATLEHHKKRIEGVKKEQKGKEISDINELLICNMKVIEQFKSRKVGSELVNWLSFYVTPREEELQGELAAYSKVLEKYKDAELGVFGKLLTKQKSFIEKELKDREVERHGWVQTIKSQLKKRENRE